MSIYRYHSVLFLCGHNAGRSQMSAAWFNHQSILRFGKTDRFYAYSAGSSPAMNLNPKAVEVMLELGVDMRECFPKKWTQDLVDSVQFVISMGCGDKCPVIETTVCRDWNLPDPHGQNIDAVRKVRNAILPLVDALMEEMIVMNTRPVA